MRARLAGMILVLGPLVACTAAESAPLQGSVPPLDSVPEGLGTLSAPTVGGPDVLGVPDIHAPVAVNDPIRQRYEDAVRRGDYAEANRIGLGMMAGSEPCGPDGAVVVLPGPFSRPCGVVPLDDFSLRRRHGGR